LSGMNILHLVSSGGMYGAESVIAALARDLQDMGHAVRVGVFENRHCDQNDVADQMQERGLTVIRIPCDGRIDLSTVRTIRKAIESEGTHILHTHGYKADIYGYFAARPLALPMVATCHLWTRQTPAIRAYERLDAFFLRRFSAIVAVSDAIAREVRQAGVAPTKITTIDNGIDLTPYLLGSATLWPEIRERGDLLIGTAGRLVSQKGIGYFLRSAKEVLRVFPNAAFIIVGDGPDRAELERLATELSISDKVVFAGRRTDMPDVYASLDIFVLASLDEGMPMAILEAMAAGCPVIATQVGAVPKLIESGQTGATVPPANVEALSQAMLTMIHRPEMRRELARNARALVTERHSSRAMSRKYEEIYRQLTKCADRRLTAVSVAD